MMCYRDRSFCGLENCKHFHSCEYACNDEVYRRACCWWGSDNPPISIRYPTDGICYEPMEDMWELNTLQRQGS